MTGQLAWAAVPAHGSADGCVPAGVVAAPERPHRIVLMVQTGKRAAAHEARGPSRRRSRLTLTGNRQCRVGRRGTPHSASFNHYGRSHHH